MHYMNLSRLNCKYYPITSLRIYINTKNNLSGYLASMQGVWRTLNREEQYFDYYRNRTEILCIQETHCDADAEQKWKLEWGGRCIFSHGTKTSRGVAILFKKDFFCNINKICSDNEGRFLICELSFGDDSEAICLCNIYAPNYDSPNFFVQLSDQISQYCAQKILIGDFNLVMDTKLDRVGSDHNNKNALLKLNCVINEYYLTEIWRERNPESTRFSWRRVNSKKQQHSRIDFALVSKGFSDMIENCTYIASLFTDHSAFYLCVSTSKNKRGTGYWKFNQTLLQNNEVLDAIVNGIKSLTSSKKNCTPIDSWQQIKRNIAMTSQNLSRKIAQEDKEVIAHLSEKTSEYEELFPLAEKDMSLYLKTKADLEEKMLRRAEKLIFRSKVRWYEYGERNSKYFYSLERARFNAKTCQKLITDTGTEITDDSDILREQHSFYSKLYARDNYSFSIRNTHGVIISEEMYNMCNAPITKTEVRRAIKMMKRAKTPGDDGLPIELYEAVWDELEPAFFEMLEESYAKGTLHLSARSGVLNLIPKAGKDSRFLKNLRPITLLNTDYKLIEKVLANRLDQALHAIIHGDQTGFMAGRRISTNIRNVLDVIQHCDNHQIDSVLLNLDFAKCFDNIAFSAIIGSLQFFNFPPLIQRWVTILYTDFRVRIQNNGKFTSWVDVQKSVHQGGCISVQLFLLCAEIIALELRQCEKIKGVPMDEIINLLNQYADDMNISSLFDQESVDSIFQKLEFFRNNSGFRLNYDKTEMYRMGSIHGSHATLYTQKQVKWTNEPVKVLGVLVGKGTADSNYESVLAKIKPILDTWAHRRLSLVGKINVINTLISSLFVYKLSVLPTPSHDFIKKVNKILVEFIWGGKRAKISLDVLQASKSAGGLNLVNLHWRNDALKISWIKILHTTPKSAAIAYQFLIPQLKEIIWECNLKCEDIKWFIQRKDNPFWYDVLAAWCKYNYCADPSQQKQVLWCNSLIRIGGKPILLSKCVEKGLIYVDQLYSGRSCISAIAAARDFNLNVMEYNSIISAIPGSLKTRYTSGDSATTPPQEYVKLIGRANMTQVVYRSLANTNPMVTNKCEKWNQELEINLSNQEFVQHVRRIYVTTNNPKLRSFQFRLLYRGIITNSHLFRWTMRETNLCSFCETDKESYRHLFWDCSSAKELWNSATNIGYDLSGSYMNLTLDNIIFNKVSYKGNHVLNLLCLITKQYIYAQRCKGSALNGIELKAKILSVRNIEGFIAKKNNLYEKHAAKWYINE